MRQIEVLRLTVVLAVATGAVLAAADSQPKVRPTVPVASLFPLEEGNWWLYRKQGPGGDTSWRVEVGSATERGHGQRYHQLVGYFPGPPRGLSRHPADAITEYVEGTGRDSLWYLLASPPGTAWELQLAALPAVESEPSCISGSRLTVAARAERVLVPAGEFTTAIRIDWRPPCADAGITSEWFVPGVGLVKRVETSIAGPLTSELRQASVGSLHLPEMTWATGVTVDRPVYWNNLMPPVGPDAAPILRGAFAVRNDGDEPVSLRFAGCQSVTVEVRDESEEVVLRERGDDGGCCACENIIAVTLRRSSLALPFAFRLASSSGSPLRDGHYTVAATLDIVDPGARPQASARVEIRSAY